MAGKKSKGKKAVRKSAPRKTVRKTAPRKQVAPKAQVAAAAPAAESTAPATKTPPEYPWNVLVIKGAETLPVTVTDEDHFKRLVAEFGASCVEVKS